MWTVKSAVGIPSMIKNALFYRIHTCRGRVTTPRFSWDPVKQLLFKNVGGDLDLCIYADIICCMKYYVCIYHQWTGLGNSNRRPNLSALFAITWWVRDCDFEISWFRCNPYKRACADPFWSVPKLARLGLALKRGTLCCTDWMLEIVSPIAGVILLVLILHF